MTRYAIDWSTQAGQPSSAWPAVGAQPPSAIETMDEDGMVSDAAGTAAPQPSPMAAEAPHLPPQMHHEMHANATTPPLQPMAADAAHKLMADADAVVTDFSVAAPSRPEGGPAPLPIQGF